MPALTLDAMLAHYATSHRDSRNELIHCICVPAILFAVLGMLFSLHLAIALLAIAAALIYYHRLERAAALQMALILLTMLAIWFWLIPPHHILLVAGTIFVLAWIGQFIGHIFEGAKPSFLEDLQYLLIGPLFVLSLIKQAARRQRS